MATVWVYADVSADGAPDATALEVLTKARSLGADAVEAVVVGPGATQAASVLGEYGASTVYASDDAVFADYVGDPAAHVLEALVAEHHPSLILFATSYASRDVAGRLSAATGSTLMSNATDASGGDSAPTQNFGG